MFRLLKVAKDGNRPVNWVLLENVEALLDRIGNQPPPIAFILQQLEELGYGSWAYRVINSTGFGIPMRRKRVFIVASIHGDARDVLLTQGMQPCLGACRQLFEDHPCYACHKLELLRRTSNKDINFAIDLGQATAKPGEDVVPSLTTSNDRILLLLRDGRVGMLRVEDGERLQGLPEGWTRNVYPVSGDGLHGHRRQQAREFDLETHNSKRWQLLGNAVTVDVARWLGERLMNPYSYKYRNSEGTFRMDELMYEGMKDENAKAGGKREVDGGSALHRGFSREPINVWSFVTVDEIQEAAIFSFRGSGENKRARLHLLQVRQRSEVDGGVDAHAGVQANANIIAKTDEYGTITSAEQEKSDVQIDEDVSGAAATGKVNKVASKATAGVKYQTETRRMKNMRLEIPNASSCEAVNALHNGDEESYDANGPGGLSCNTGRDRIGTAKPRGDNNSNSETREDRSKKKTPALSALSGCHHVGSPERKTTLPASDDLIISTPNKTQDKANTNDGNDANVTTPAKPTDPNVMFSDDDLVMSSDADMQPYKDRFQAKTFNKIKKGQLQSTFSKDSRRSLAQSVDKTWPKCAWAQKGMGAFGVTRWSDHPVMCPYHPLDDFIMQVGRSPTQEERAGYVHRLKEKGWDISEEVMRRITGEHNLGIKSAGVTRIKGVLEDFQMVGELVWAPWKDTSTEAGEIYWPAEVLDPTNMPAGRVLPKHALDRLSSDEKRASTISVSGAWDPKDYAESEHRRVLVVFFPVNNGKWQWYHPRALLPWEEHRDEYQKVANAIIQRPNFSHAEMLTRALQDARESHGVKTQVNRLHVDKMIQTRAAAASAMVDLKQRCGRCRTCMNAYAGTKRFDCLTQRMTASALGGHAGAQLSMCGEKAIGARVAVWWDGDEEYFEGTLCWYDPVSTEHTVAYDDGEIGMHRLWQHDEHILIKSEIEDWYEEAAAVRKRLTNAMNEPLSDSPQDIENNKRATELAKRMPELTEYEQSRQEKIQEIQAVRRQFYSHISNFLA